MTKSLNEFALEELRKFNLPTTEKNMNKLRRKVTPILKDPYFLKMGHKKSIWSNGETKVIGRNSTRFFKEKDLRAIEKAITPYMEKLVIKNSSLSKEKFQKKIEDANKEIKAEDERLKTYKNPLLKDFSPLPKDNNDNPIISSKQLEPEYSKDDLQSEIDHIMLKAIFNKLFDAHKDWENRFVKDYNLIVSATPSSYSDPRYIAAVERLNHPKGEKSYFQDKNN